MKKSYILPLLIGTTEIQILLTCPVQNPEFLTSPQIINLYCSNMVYLEK